MEIEILNQDDLNVGDFVTVIKGAEYNSSFGEEMFSNVKTVVREDNSYKGDVLEIKALNLPFIVLKRHSQYSCERSAITLDLRKWKFMKITESFIKEALKKDDSDLKEAKHE